MRKTITRVALVATLATSLVASFAATANAAGTGTNTAQSNGSDAALYLYNTGGTVRSSFAFDADAFAASTSSSISSTIDCPTGSTSTPQLFASTRGNERIVANWTAYADAGYVGGTTSINQANLKLNGLTNGNNKGDLTSGANRDFSLGIACFNGSTVTKVFYRYITVTAVTGAWTAAASAYSYPTPTLSDNRAQGQALHTGDTLTASVGADSAIPSGFTVSYQWYSGDTTLLSNETNATYLLKDTDGGLTFKVKATYTDSTLEARPAVSVYSLPTATVVGNSNLTGSVTVNAGVVAAINGQLALSFVNAPTGTDGQYARSVSLTGALNGSNQSVSTGSLPDIKVSDGRVTSLAAWTLSASVTDFGRVTGQTVSTTDLILKSALGITPTVDSKPADRTVTAGTARTSGQAFATAYVLASTAAVADPGNDGSKVYTGDTVVKTSLSLLAPQWKTAGNYQSTMSLTLVGQ
jgi:hypothetical protein